MFHQIPKKMLDRLKYLEQLDNQYRTDGPYSKILWQIPEAAGKFISLMATTVPKGNYIEIGTGGGYSALWIALACRKFKGRKLITYEIDDFKINLAKETFNVTEMTDIIELVEGDALDSIDNVKNISFCFLDIEDKSIYEECFEIVFRNMIKGGLFIADNAISHKFALKSMLDNIFNDKRVASTIIPVGKGELVCRKL